MTSVWLVRADGGKLADEFRADNHISIGFSIAEDLSGVTDLSVIEAAFRRANPEKGQGAVTLTVGQIDTFLNEIQPGDHVLAPRREHKWLMHGVVGSGPAYFVPKPGDPDHHGNRRPVEWADDDIYRDDCAPADRGKLKDRRTIALVNGSADVFLESIDTSTADALRRLRAVKDRLSWDEFQDLVGRLLAAMGCEDIRVAGPGPDDGVDITAVISDTLTPNVPLFVQVKHYEPGNNIQRSTVRELRSGIQFGGQGVFVTTSDFVKRAREIATEPGFPQIALINGRLLVELLHEHWAKMDVPQSFHDHLDDEFGTPSS